MGVARAAVALALGTIALSVLAPPTSAAATRTIHVGDFAIDVPQEWRTSADYGHQSRTVDAAAAEFGRAFRLSGVSLAKLRILDTAPPSTRVVLALGRSDDGAGRLLSKTLGRVFDANPASVASLDGPRQYVGGGQPGFQVLATSTSGDDIALYVFTLTHSSENVGVVAFWDPTGATERLSREARIALLDSIRFGDDQPRDVGQAWTSIDWTAWRLALRDALWGSGVARTAGDFVRRALLLIVFFSLTFVVLLQGTYVALRRIALAQRRQRGEEDLDRPIEDGELLLRQETIILGCALASMSLTAWMVYVLAG